MAGDGEGVDRAERPAERAVRVGLRQRPEDHADQAQDGFGVASDRLGRVGAEDRAVDNFKTDRPQAAGVGGHVREDVPALLDEAASRHNIPYSLTPPLGEAPALLDLVHDVVSAGVKDATPDADDGGFGFFGAIAEMIEAENSR